MKNISPSPVRAAKLLYASACQEVDLVRLVKCAYELRLLGRPDLSINILAPLTARPGSAKECLIEKALCLEALGYTSEALGLVSQLKQDVQADFNVLELELKLIVQLGEGGIAGFDFSNIIQSVQSVGHLERMLTGLTFARLPVAYFPSILATILKIWPSKALHYSVKFVYQRLKLGFAQAVVAIFFSVLQFFLPKKKIYFSSMGKFTRLADLIDQVDSMLRRLNSYSDAPNHKLYVFFFGGYPNQKLFEMYNSHCTFLPTTGRISGKLARYFIGIIKLAGRYTEITVDYRKINTDFMSAPPVIGFSTDETRALKRKMEHVGIDPDKPIICFGLRDMAYYQFYGDVMNIPLEQQGRRSKTHHRCPPIDTYVRFAQFWAEQGYQVVRMGLRVSEPLPKGTNPLIIDYASGSRSDELDAFLFARCRFLTAGDTGLFSGAAAFDRPAVVSDLFLIQNTIYSSNKDVRNIFVPKLIYDMREERYLSFREQIYFNGFFSYHVDCEKSGFKIVHNSPDDIIDASIELDDRLAGKYETSQEGDDLQKAFHSIYTPGHVGYGSTGLVSARFLKKYSYLLD